MCIVCLSCICFASAATIKKSVETMGERERGRERERERLRLRKILSMEAQEQTLLRSQSEGHGRNVIAMSC